MLLRGKLPDVDLAALEERLADPALGDRLRGELLFALAHVLDARGDYFRAAGCLREANSLRLRQAAEPYVPAEHQHFVNRLVQVFDRDFFTRTAGWGLDTRQPVFVFGLPRSGTTLIEQILASHPQVYGRGELQLARRSFEALPATLACEGPPMDCVARLDRATTARLAEQHLTRLVEKVPGTFSRIVDKMPENHLFLGLLVVMFPRATFIHCRRDLRDIAVSCWMTDFNQVTWANDCEHIAARFQQYRRMIEHWRQVFPLPVHDVDYEETVADLETVARRLIAACGLEWDPACVEFYRTQRPIRTASVQQVRQPVSKKSVDRWRNYEGELGELFEQLPSGG